jgi:RNA polymerase sigma-70 factor (ECF subfamily)
VAPTTRESLRAFYQAHQEELLAYAIARTGCHAAAEDAVHGVFCNLLTQATLPRDLRPYVFSALRNATTDVHRNLNRQAKLRELLPPLNGTTPPARIAEQDEAAHWLSLLTDDELEAVVLKLYSGLTFREIASIHGVTVNTAASWYRRGIERIRDHVGGESS